MDIGIHYLVARTGYSTQFCVKITQIYSFSASFEQTVWERAKYLAPVIEYNLARCDDDGNGNDEQDSEADVQVFSYSGKLLPVRNFLS